MIWTVWNESLKVKTSRSSRCCMRWMNCRKRWMKFWIMFPTTSFMSFVQKQTLLARSSVRCSECLCVSRLTSLTNTQWLSLEARFVSTACRHTDTHRVSNLLQTINRWSAGLDGGFHRVVVFRFSWAAVISDHTAAASASVVVFSLKSSTPEHQLSLCCWHHRP